jgi:sensor histidine kinase YesM
MSFLSYLKSRLQLIGWITLGGCIMTPFVCDVCSGSVSWFLKISLFTITIWVSMWLGNEYMAHFLDQKISWTKEPLKRFITGILAMLVYTVAVIVILVYLFEFGFQIDIGGTTRMLYGTVIITSVITLFMTSRSFLYNWKQAAIHSERLQKESITAQYNSLKSQVNPHFLFNSLNALTSLVYEDQDKAAKFIKQLSEVYRYVLDTRDKEIVSMEEELKFLDSYLFLQKIRFGDNLSVELNLSSRQKLIAPLALQMLVENAIKHNIASSENPLSIKITEKDGYIIVENSLQRKNMPEEYSPGLGLENIKSRYTFLSNQPVVVEESKEKFSVKLPVIESDER